MLIEKNQFSNSNVLIIGGDSPIGDALKHHLTKENFCVTTTSRHKHRCINGTIYFDLNDLNENIDFGKFQYVVICAAISNFDECEKYPTLCERVNVQNTKVIIDRCVSSNCFFVFISTAAVFDGSKSFYRHTDSPNPTSLYGKSKLEVENYIKNLSSNNGCILRLTKVITTKSGFINNWLKQSLISDQIIAFDNRFISPLQINDVVDSIYLLLKQREQGIFQLGGTEEISFFDFANLFFSNNPDFLKKFIPAPATDLFSGSVHNSLITHLPNYNKSYSFEGSDLISNSLLRNVSRGLYIDVGANHPVHQNNTYHFYQKQWRGLAIDGNGEFEDLWAKHRPLDIFRCELLSDDVRNVEFAIYPDNTLSTIDSSAIERYTQRYDSNQIVKTSKKTCLLYDIYKNYFFDQEIHLLSVDVEGEDLNCLKGSRLDLWKPGVILIETKNLSLYDVHSNEIVSYLTNLGYKLIAKTPLDAIFIFPQKPYFSWIPSSII